MNINTNKSANVAQDKLKQARNGTKDVHGHCSNDGRPTLFLTGQQDNIRIARFAFRSLLVLPRLTLLWFGTFDMFARLV